MAPLLADKVAEVELAIVREDYASLEVDEYLIQRLHRDIAGELTPAIAGRWRQIDVQVGAHEAPPHHRLAELMRAYSLDLTARLNAADAENEGRLLETLAFAEGRLLSIHPFADFNGRVTRVFLAELLRRLNLPAVDPTPRPGPPTHRYLAALAAADGRNWGPLKSIWLERLEADEFFALNFERLTAYAPMQWQVRLFHQHFISGDLPTSVDVPTGLGKTAVMAVWLIALAWQLKYLPKPTLPRRLVYVVDRRAVVDQATAFAEQLVERLAGDDGEELRTALGLVDHALPVSTLRGQFVDNRDWLDDPSSPAVVVATVDMAGSRLLFGGYGVSPRMRPYHAGLLGCDTLIVLDEAHLVPPFEKLLESMTEDADAYAAPDTAHRALIPPLKALSLSATGRRRDGETFALEGDALAAPGERGDLDDALIARRLSARKSLAFVESTAALAQALAEQAWQLAGQRSSASRCVVFCNSRDVAEDVQGLIEKKLRREHASNTELLVGARRVRERDLARARLESLGFLAGTPGACDGPSFLVATSAGEVGIDLDADHMVCDLVEWDRMVQRLGRVNRRGDGDAQIRVVLEPLLGKKPAEQDRLAARRTTLMLPLAQLPRHSDGGFDASPGALRQLYARAATEAVLRIAIDRATTEPPLRPALTRALVDAWSMTSLDEHTGRPVVQPWLRGWVADEPQTTVVWRTHLPVRRRGSVISTEDVEEFFEAAPPHLSEALETETRRVHKWLQQRCEALAKRGGLGGESELATAASEVIGFVLSGANRVRCTVRLADLLAEAGKVMADEFKSRLAGSVLVLDARLGGLALGLLDPSAEELTATADTAESWGAMTDARPIVGFRVRSIVGTDAEAHDRWLPRHRIEVERDEEGNVERCLIVEKWRGDAANERDRAIARTPQLLSDHQDWTENKARQLAGRLGWSTQWTEVLALAARLHDEGKRASVWQRAFNAPKGPSPYAKTRGPINQRLLGHYRHEFGSLPYAQRSDAFRGLPAELQDLVLHLIAAHHGQARPVIGTLGCEDAPPEALTRRAADVALRFARLQRRWGPWGLAWWEALLRAADQQASRENDEKGAG